MTARKTTPQPDDRAADDAVTASVAAAETVEAVDVIETVEAASAEPVDAVEVAPEPIEAAAATPITEVPAADPDVTFASVSDAFTAATDGPEGVDAGAAPQYGVGPFSVREVALGGLWLVAFLVSFFPIYVGIGAGSGASVWASGIDWTLTIGVPTVAVFLIGLRRLSPQGIRRVGSLGVDQFASVAFSVSAVLWLGILWKAFATLFAAGVFLATWVVWVELVLMLAGVVLTVCAPLIPVFGEDFRHRPEVPAHRFASPARPVVARPAPVVVPQPAAAAPYGVPYGAAPAAYGAESPSATGPVEPGATGAADPYATGAVEPLAAEPAAAEPAPAASQAFWALAPTSRDVVDEHGVPVFTIGPTAWALVIEDRGDHYVVRHEDGRIGYLTDVSGVTRG
ncbi:hypothetical protein [Microbacterium sp.]|uniref:hypothetical protein n=1 Tax=Microbacterium sp. TaxID=51671 RepID=UPI0039E66116